MSLLEVETDYALSLLDRTHPEHPAVISSFTILLTLALAKLNEKSFHKPVYTQFWPVEVPPALISSFEELLINRLHYIDGILGRYGRTTKFEATDVDLINQGAGSMKAAFLKNGGAVNLMNFYEIRPAMERSFNALFFKGEWKNKFSSSKTQKKAFHFMAEEDYKVPNKRNPYYGRPPSKKMSFMTNLAAYDYAENEKARLVRIPYTEKDYTLSVVLPKKRFGLNELLETSNGATLQSLFNRAEPKTIELSLPRMAFMHTTDWIKDYSVQRCDSWPGCEDLRAVSRVVSKTLFEIDEEGSMATAPWLDLIWPDIQSNRVEAPASFIVDEPFLFVLTFENRPLFIGRYQGYPNYYDDLDAR